MVRSDFNSLAVSTARRGTRAAAGKLTRTLALAALLVATHVAPSLADEPGQRGSLWDLGTLERGRTYRTRISAHNRSCRAPHSFSIAIEGEASEFLELTGPSMLTGIPRGAVKTTDAVIDLRGMPAGQFNDGVVVIRCIDCPESCYQDHELLAVALRVREPLGAQNAGEPDGVPGPCPESTSSCDELLARARRLQAEAEAAQASADRALDSQPWHDAEADAIDESVERDREYVATLRRQAGEWRELARDAEQDAARNERRANKHPPDHPYHREWMDAARRDRETAARRRREAERLDAEADRIERNAADRGRDAVQRRERARELQRRAEEKWAAAEQAFADYEDCLERLRRECEERERLRTASPAGTSAGSTGGGMSAQGDGASAAPAGSPPPVTLANDSYRRNYRPMRARVEKVCQTITFEVPRGTFTARAEVVAFRDSDAPGSIEIEILDRESRATGRGFTYHCIAPGSAIVAFVEQTGSELRRRRFRIFCEP